VEGSKWQVQVENKIGAGFWLETQKECTTSKTDWSIIFKWIVKQKDGRKRTPDYK
jgi:hypothetical protein